MEEENILGCGARRTQWRVTARTLHDASAVIDDPLLLHVTREALDGKSVSVWSPARPDEPTGTEQLVEVSLSTDDYPGGPEARILKTWDG